MRLSEVINTAIGKALIGVILFLIAVIVAISMKTLVISGERNVLQQTVKTKEAEISGKNKDVAFMKAWMERDKLDTAKKESEYNRTMEAKPKFKTVVEYMPTGDKCKDYDAIINEIRRTESWAKSIY